jgi:hypothetical protein
MTIRISTPSRDGACNAIVDLIDVGGSPAKLQLWSGSRPATLGDPPAGTKLAEFSLPNPCFGAAATGVATAAAITGTTGLAAGTVGFAVVRSRGDVAIWDNNDVGTSGTQLVLNTLSISVGVAVTVVSWTTTMPAT